jgi:DNA replication and repair protein RecF
LQLSRIKLVHFKNYTDQELHLATRLNGFVGQNGMGKTNLLDAIYYLCMGKSYFAVRDLHLVQHEQDFFRLEGDFEQDEQKTRRLVVKVVPRKKKELELNRILYEKIADHVGVFPVVIVVPDDTQLIHEGSEERRRFLDNTLSQLDAVYLSSLIAYNNILKQRNALLKQQHGRPLAENLLSVYDLQLLAPAQYIFNRRQAFVADFLAPFRAAHQAICGSQEEVSLTYRSSLADQDLGSLLRQAREKDRVLERTTVGIHRDELVFQLGDHPLKRLGSQGQLKSFVVALKLAQYRFLQAQKGVNPLLLLDDIFDKLDPQRVDQLVRYLLTGDFGQVFISDTDSHRISRILQQAGVAAKLFLIADGEAAEMEF